MAARQSHDVLVFGATSFVGQILVRYLLRAVRHRRQPALGDRPAARGRSWRPCARRSVQGRRQAGARAGRCGRRAVAAASCAGRPGSSCPRSDRMPCTANRSCASVPRPAPITATSPARCSGSGACSAIRGHGPQARLRGSCTAADSIRSLPTSACTSCSSRRASASGVPARTVKMRVKTMRGGFSGGTVASLLNVCKEVIGESRAAQGTRRSVFDLSRRARVKRVRQPNVRFAEHDPDFDAWIAPFVMSAINTRIVHRTNALLGARVRRRISAMTKRCSPAVACAAAPGRHRDRRRARRLHGRGCHRRRCARALRTVRAAGTGRGPESGAAAQRAASTCVSWPHRRRAQSCALRVTGDRDPGYGSTAKMLGQAAACLAIRRSQHDSRPAASGHPRPFRRPARRTACRPIGPDIRTARRMTTRGHGDSEGRTHADHH